MIVPQRFYNRSADKVAPDLLGCFLVHRSPQGTTVGRIVEVEAYLGKKDPASHAHRGPTKRNVAMFGPPGHAYVYFTYGMHWCFNVVTSPAGVGEGVLIRALEPVRGIPLMQRRRRQRDLDELTNGPAKLVQAMGITTLHYGVPVYRGALRIVDRFPGMPERTKEKTVRGPRIGIREATKLPLRFHLAANPFVSR